MSSPSSSTSTYSRNTELRNVEANDLYKLAVILEDDNYWQQLMEIIPKEINNQTFSTESLESSAYARKYSNDHIRLIEGAIRRTGDSRLYSEILFDEWGTSGRKQERPTLGVLMHLLVQSKLYRAADYVADLLKESKPIRPSNGPAAEYEFPIDVFQDIQEIVHGDYPTTEELQENKNTSCMNVNKDYYTKYHECVEKKLPPIKENNMELPTSTTPKPPPRSQKLARITKHQQMLQLQQLTLMNQTAASSSSSNTNNVTPNCIVQENNQQHQQNHQLNTNSNNENLIIFSTTINNVTPNCVIQQNNQQHQHDHQLNTNSNNENQIILSTTSTSTNIMPKLSDLLDQIKPVENTTRNYSVVSENSLPNLSFFNNDENPECSSNGINSPVSTKSNIATEGQLYELPTVINSIKVEPRQNDEDNDESHHDLPVISALNINGERDDGNGVSLNSVNNTENLTSVFEDDDDDDDFDIPYTVANIYNDRISQRHYLEAIDENEDGNELDVQEDEDDDNSLPNLSFLDNGSSNNESSLTSVTNTSGDNSFDKSF